MERPDLIRKLEEAGREFVRHGGNSLAKHTLKKITQ
jgi:hypothetical protein